MTIQADYINDDDYFDGTASADLACGDLVFDAGGRAGVITAMNGVANGDTYKAQASGRYTVAAKTTDTFSVGSDVFWDASEAEATSTATGNNWIGVADTAKTDGQTSVVTLLNGRSGAFSGYLDKAQQAISGAGAITVTEYYTAWTTTGVQAGTLADGTFVGQLKKIQLIVDGGNGTLTPANLNGGTTITFADAGDYALLRWNGSGWTALELGNDADGATAPALA